MNAALAGKTVAVLYGGRSGERAVSIDSAQMVIAALREGGHAPRTVDTADARWWELLDGVDVAFNIQHGRGGEDGVTQGLLAELGVPCTGSDVLGSALAMDKLRSKQLWTGAGLPTADFALVDASTDTAALLARWGAAFVKPAREGSSLGMSCVREAADFAAAIATAAERDSLVLAERFIDGPEYTVGVLGDRALPTIRIEVDSGFYDYQAKYVSDDTRYLIPSGLSDAEEAAVGDLALRAFSALGCSVWGRVDLMRDGDEFLLLEVNTVPGMTSHSLVPMAARAAGLSATALVETILELTLAREERGHGD